MGNIETTSFTRKHLSTGLVAHGNEYTESPSIEGVDITLRVLTQPRQPVAKASSTIIGKRDLYINEPELVRQRGIVILEADFAPQAAMSWLEKVEQPQSGYPVFQDMLRGAMKLIDTDAFGTAGFDLRWTRDEDGANLCTMPMVPAVVAVQALANEGLISEKLKDAVIYDIARRFSATVRELLDITAFAPIAHNMPDLLQRATIISASGPKELPDIPGIHAHGRQYLYTFLESDDTFHLGDMSHRITTAFATLKEGKSMTASDPELIYDSHAGTDKLMLRGLAPTLAGLEIIQYGSTASRERIDDYQYEAVKKFAEIFEKVLQKIKEQSPRRA